MIMPLTSFILRVGLALACVAIAFVAWKLVTRPAGELRDMTKAVLRSLGVRWFYVSGVADTPTRGCPFCGETVHAIAKAFEVKSPRGETFKKETRLGYCCLRCGTAARSDLYPASGWVDVKEFLSTVKDET